MPNGTGSAPLPPNPASGRPGSDWPRWEVGGVEESDDIHIGRTRASRPAVGQGIAELVRLDELHDTSRGSLLVGLIAHDDFRHARNTAEALLPGSDRPGGHAALAEALTALAVVALDDGRVAEALGLFRAAARRTDVAPLPARRPCPHLGLAPLLTALGEFDEAEAVITASATQIELLGDKALAGAPAIRLACLHLAAGRLDSALAEADAGLATADEVGTRLFVPAAVSVFAAVALLRGDLDAAAAHTARYRDELHSNLEMPSDHAPVSSGTSAWLEARLADARYGARHAVSVLAPIYDDPVAHSRLFVNEPAATAWMVRRALAVGDRPRAERVLACAEALVDRNPGFASLLAGASHARGLIDRDATMLDRAAAGYRHPWARASACEDAGVMLAERDRVTARAQLERALATYEQAGADRDAARVRARLGALGVRRCGSSRARRPVFGWESLTDTERRVADLVAEGLTNREVAQRMFLSPHTVDFHLRHVFQKLGIRSRVELARLALLQGADAR